MTKRLIWLALPLLALAGSALALALDERQGLREWLALRGRVERAKGRVLALAGRRDALTSEIRALRRDDLAVEALARESLGWVRRGEVVVRLDGEAPREFR